jgi:hypothetical protein
VKRSRLKRRKAWEPEDELERIAHDLFREAARRQRLCQMCGTAKSWHPHHVVYEQHLEDAGVPVYDSRNSMRLCVECHASHHGRSKVVPLVKLTDMHIEYAFLALGAAAHSYLNLRYDGEDPRVDEYLAKFEGGDLDRRIASTTV